MTNLERVEANKETSLPRYIDAELIKFTELYDIGNFFARKEQIDEIPTANVEPAVHAHWVEMPNYAYSIFPYHCSSCGFLVGYKSRYCPDCGARMDEEV